MNPDGTYTCGGAYDGYRMNPDGTYKYGGAYDEYQMNPDGTYVCGEDIGIVSPSLQAALFSLRYVPRMDIIHVLDCRVFAV